ncbi:MAG TPA: hypothetical protein VFC63_02515 [Blastocatellia bacterium]|nr:hypothetical protein [Blastocatellia bacterium]
MGITIELPADLEHELAAEAASLGLSLPDYVLRVLSSTIIAGEGPKTGQQLLEYWRSEGLIGTRPDITDSASHAREIRKIAEDRFNHGSDS